MDSKIKAEWVTALRSGEYQQARGSFKDKETGAYCALGVLCEPVLGEPALVEDVYGWMSNWAAISPHLIRSQEVAVYDRNDGQGWTFAELADWIEAEL